MITVALFGVAFASSCGLPVDIDPNNMCELDQSGYPSVDADSDPAIPIKLTISSKSAHVDAFRKNHSGTIGTLDDDTGNDGRYVLHCPQASGEKTVKFTVKRPKAYAAFGGEWLKLYPKDSWDNQTIEYEPFTFNHYGAKIPLPEFRPMPSGLENDPYPQVPEIGLNKDDQAPDKDEVNFFMEVSGTGDYELRYANPGIHTPGEVVIEYTPMGVVGAGPTEGPDFTTNEACAQSAIDNGMAYPFMIHKMHTSWTTPEKCAWYSMATTETGKIVGTDVWKVSMRSPPKWVAVEFKSTTLRVGTPWAECSENALNVQTALNSKEYDVGIIMPVLFGHPNLHKKSIALREGFADYDAIIADLKDVSVPVKVVLEIYNAQHAIMGNGRRYTDSADDGQCYKAGTDCPENHFVCKPEYCEIDVWRKIIGDFKRASTKVEVLGSINSGTTTTMYTDVFKVACNTKSNVACIALDGFYFAQGESVPAGLGDGLTTVSVTGQPLFDASAMNDATVHVTLTDTASKLGVWTPYSWYPSIQPQKWAAIVTDASLTHDTSKDHTIPDDGTDSQTSTLDTLFDRGYGWVYLTDQASFSTEPTNSGSGSGFLSQVLRKVEAVSTKKRRLQSAGLPDSALLNEVQYASSVEARSGFSVLSYLSPFRFDFRLPPPEARRLQASFPFWGCDDTLLECKPICLKQHGHVTNKVSSKLCAGAPMDQCACKCYHEAQWTCEGDSVVCKAKFAEGELQTVGDKVCEMRGAPKPMAPEELRDAGFQITSMCEPMKEMRGSAPTAECLAQWKAAEVTSEDQVYEEWLQESFTVAVALGALGLYA
jgi:hypothetical protein